MLGFVFVGSANLHVWLAARVGQLAVLTPLLLLLNGVAAPRWLLIGARLHELADVVEGHV